MPKVAIQYNSLLQQNVLKPVYVGLMATKLVYKAVAKIFRVSGDQTDPSSTILAK